MGPAQHGAAGTPGIAGPAATATAAAIRKEGTA
jgi:hypothetical protein